MPMTWTEPEVFLVLNRELDHIVYHAYKDGDGERVLSCWYNTSICEDPTYEFDVRELPEWADANDREDHVAIIRRAYKNRHLKFENSDDPELLEDEPASPDRFVLSIYDPDIDAMIRRPMSDDQIQAAMRILDGKSGIYRLTGGAGRGKSALISWLSSELPNVRVCALTARAALAIGGITIDSLFGYNRRTGKVDYDRMGVNLSGVEWVIVDEASMIGHKMAEMLVDVIEAADFGLILVGDWAQAPPINESWPLASPILTAGETLKLTTCHRQEAGAYLEALDQLRRGRIPPHVDALFRMRVGPPPEDETCVRLYGRNDAADAHNHMMLMRLVQQFNLRPTRFMAEFVESYGRPRYNAEGILTDSCMAHNIEMAVGARVMMTRNTYDYGFVNGDSGELDGFLVSNKRKEDLTPDLLKRVAKSQCSSSGVSYTTQPVGPVVGVVVKLDRTDDLVVVPRSAQIYHRPDGSISYAVSGFPIRLGWAITVHKSQGMTLKQAYFDMHSLWHEHGLAYVGLSRTKTLEGLTLSAWRSDLIYSDPAIANYL